MENFKKISRIKAILIIAILVFSFGIVGLISSHANVQTARAEDFNLILTQDYGATVVWTDKCSSDGYWELTAVDDAYSVTLKGIPSEEVEGHTNGAILTPICAMPLKLMEVQKQNLSTVPARFPLAMVKYLSQESSMKRMVIIGV